MIAIIDTCIIIDALQKREPFVKAAKEIFHIAATYRCDCYITAKSLADIYYIMHRATHNDSETRLIIYKLSTLFNIADTMAVDTQNATFSDISDFEDAIIHATAQRIKADYIVTRNIKDYKKSLVAVLSPNEFVSKVGI